MRTTVLVENHYLPSIEFFCSILPYEKIILEVSEYFVKQTLRNRCVVNTAQGKKLLTVPLTERHGKILVKDILVEPGIRWRNIHWRTIESAYRKAPYFEYYSQELNKILYHGHKYLVDLNSELLSFCLHNLGFSKELLVTLTYEEKPGENIFDLRSLISDKKHFNERNFYFPVKYYQVFGNEFVPNLSSIDLLFCEGPRAREIIRASCHSPNE
jgi:hypothetical protein